MKTGRELGETEMRNIVLMIRLLLFLLSSYGYWDYFRKEAKMNVFFLPAFTICLQTMLLFFAGLLNILKPVAVLIFAFGLLLAVVTLYREGRESIRPYLNVGYVFLGISFALVFIATKGHIFSHWDDFNHWAVIERCMLETDRYPTFKDSMVRFRSYAPGSATYIYYFSKIISGGKVVAESIQMAAQAFMMLAFILPVFKYVKKNKVISATFVLLFANFLLCYDVKIYALLVDTLLPLQAMAMLLFIYSECLRMDKNVNRGGGIDILYATPFMCMQVLIKTSGMFFAVIASLLIINSLRYERSRLKVKLAVAMSPFISFFLWHAHCDYVYPTVMTSEHAVSISYYSGIISGKTAEDIRLFSVNFINNLFSSKTLLWVVISLAVLFLIVIAVIPKMKKQYIKALAYSAGLYVVYIIGMYCMYLFSFSNAGAIGLGSFDRYQKTIFISIYYIILILFLNLLSAEETNKKTAICGITAFSVLLSNWYFVEECTTIFDSEVTPYSDAERRWIEEAAREYSVYENYAYTICIPENVVSDYTIALARYVFNSDWVDVKTNVKDTSELDDVEKGTYVFIYDRENEVIQNWVAENYPEAVGDKVILR